MRHRLGSALGAVALFAGTAVAAPGHAAPGCPAPPPMRFAEPGYVDTTRAGGEPTAQTHPDGTLLYGAHAGTTHFFTPEVAGGSTRAFYEKYTGQAYYYWSADHGKTWTFVPRTLPDNMPGSGFSDPDIAIDAAGQVYISEINLVNVAMSKSSDSGRTYVLQNFFAQTMTDRQWSVADEKDVVYLVGNAFFGGTSTNPAGNVGHFLYKSKDGGRTFTPGVADMERGFGTGDLRLDPSDGTLYEAHYDDDDESPTFQHLSIAAFRGARSDDLKPQLHTVAAGVDMLSHWPSFDLDPKGNLYIVWDESGAGKSKRAASIWYAYSTNRGRTWTAPVRVDRDARTDIWPWLAVGDVGRVAVAWLGSDASLAKHDAQVKGNHGWRVMAAQSLNGLGCDDSPVPGFTVVAATRPPIHRGTICQGGTLCQGQLIDRRLGDYFTIDIDGGGAMYAAYSDTRRGGSVALPGFVRQSGGPSFLAGAQVPPTAPAVKGIKRRRELPATGAGGSPVWIGIALLAAALLMWRRRERTG